MKKKKDSGFLDLKIPVFYNKRTGQPMSTWPKKQLELKGKKYIKVRVWK